MTVRFTTPHSKKWMDEAKTIPRCRAIAPRLGTQCSKAKLHTHELDVVHGDGLVIWRDEPFFVGPRTVSQYFTTTKPSTFSAEGGPIFRVDYTEDQPVIRKGQPTNFTIKDEAAEFRFPDKVTASPEQQLTEWWLNQAEDEVVRTVPKAIEYSATDLTDIGHDLARTAGREVSDEEAAELGVFFFIRGKVARWVGAIMAGQRVSDDTIFDIGVYVRMAQRIREVGSWPGVDLTDQSTEDRNAE